jgi:organic hydroperoxide reductase OsmC/OhrA
VPFASLECSVEGELDRIDKVSRFTVLRIHARVSVPAEVGVERAERLLHRAEQVCLISNSLSAKVELTTEVLTPA